MRFCFGVRIGVCGPRAGYVGVRNGMEIDCTALRCREASSSVPTATEVSHVLHTLCY